MNFVKKTILIIFISFLYTGQVSSSKLPLDNLFWNIKDAKIIPIEKFTSDNGNFTYHTFIAPVEEEFTPILNDEHRGFCWVALEDHPKPLHPGVWRTINFESVINKIKTLESIL